jgi:photosystem II stability/assembly factor-like uncharacterized protein
MDPALFRSLEFRLLGPHRGGRVVAVAGHPTEPGTFYFGACAGGVWKTTSGGAYWENVSDGFFKTAAVGAIAVSEADPNVLYVGTGETAIRSNVSHGDGVYRSTDGGRTWRNFGLADTRHIGRVRVHPRDPDVAYVAALGHAWGRNADRGVYRTTDGGATWEKVLFKSDRAGAVDLSLDPANPRVLYASIWQAQRYPYAMRSGGEDSGLWRSLDGGDTWTNLTRRPGLPTGLLGKIGVAASPAKAGRVWALVEAADGALFRSDDYGETWERLSENPDLRRRPWYYMHIYADPRDADTVWVLNLQCWKSADGGRTFEPVPTPHGDNHDLWIDPANPGRVIEGNDGGACVSFDGGRSWSTILNQPTAQFYHVTTDDHVPYRVYGSQQDNWAMRLPSIGFEGAIAEPDYVEPGGGESGYIAISPNPPHTVFGGGIGTGPGHGRLIAWNPDTGQKRNVTVWPEVFGGGAGAKDLPYRFQWTFPIEVSPHDPAALYVCSNHAHRSTDEGATWEVISPDLTRNDPSTLDPSGGPITADNSGAEIYGTIFAFRESPHERGVFWAGSDDGLVHLSRDGGATWQNVTPPDLPEWALVSIIEPSPHDPATAYLAATRYKLDDSRPYLFKTNDYGATWTRITGGIPDEEFTRVIRADPVRRGLLFAGTETGLYVCFDDGAHWQRFPGNLPVVPIYDLVVKGTDLVVATHGRSFWILDDLTPLRQMEDGVTGEASHLFAPRPTTRFRVYGHGNGRKVAGFVNYKMTGPVTVAFRPVETPMGTKIEDFLDAGRNPPDGAIIHYWLREKPEGEAKLAILDAEGRVVREFGSASKDAPRAPEQPGANRFVWDLRYASPTPLEDRPGLDPQRAQAEAAATAPRALPGTYRVRLTVGDASQIQPLDVLPDPRLPVSAEDLAAQFALKLAIRDRLSEVHEMLNQIQRVRRQLDEWERRVKASGDHPSILEAAKGLRDGLAAVEDDLLQVNADKPQPGTARLKEKLATLSAMIDESDDAPTRAARQVFDLLSSRVEEVQGRLRALISQDLARFDEQIRQAGIPMIAP